MNKNNFTNKPLAVLLLGSLLLPNAASADWLTFDGEEKKWAVNVGTRVWMNESEGGTQISATGYSPTNTTANFISTISAQTKSKDIEATAIPYQSARYGRFFVSGSYYSKTNFAFPSVGTGIGISESSTFNNQPVNVFSTTLNENTADLQREEWDISTGFYVLKGLAITVGYKHAEANFSNRTNSAYGYQSYNQQGNLVASQPTYIYQTISGNANNTFSGPTIGFSGSVPINSGFGLFASYTHGFMDFEFNGTSEAEGFNPDGSSREKRPLVVPNVSSQDNNYDVAELGVSYTPNIQALTAHLPLSSASVFAGYRFQRFQYSATDATTGLPLFSDTSNTNSGFVAGVNLAF